MTWMAALVIAIGAVIGAWLRWGLAILLNPLLPSLAVGTLTANMVGGLLVGMAAEFFIHHQHLSRELQLFFITGILGAFTTFSSFSLEVVTLLRTTQYAWAALVVSAHVFSALLMTALGIFLVQRWVSA